MVSPVTHSVLNIRAMRAPPELTSYDAEGSNMFSGEQRSWPLRWCAESVGTDHNAAKIEDLSIDSLRHWFASAGAIAHRPNLGAGLCADHLPLRIFLSV